MPEKKQGLNSIDIPLYGNNIEPGFIPFYEVSAELLEMKDIRPPHRRQNKRQNPPD